MQVCLSDAWSVKGWAASPNITIDFKQQPEHIILTN
jgi:hypothetical protein